MQGQSEAEADAVVETRHAVWRGRHPVSFVLPAFNEEANIVRAVEDTVAAARECCSSFEVLVVDDGSADGTADRVRACAQRHPEVRVISHHTNRGYGDALRTGFSAARLDYVFFTDADNQYDLRELPLLLAWADRADVIAGFRRERCDPPARRLNAWAWNRLVRMLFCVPVRDIDCAFKLFRHSVLENLDITSRGAMINTEVMVKVARAGCTIVEVGVTHRPRVAGRPQGAKPRVIWRACRELVRLYPALTRLESPPPPRTVPTIDLRSDDSPTTAARA